jgi:hypothetical protein
MIYIYIEYIRKKWCNCLTIFKANFRGRKLYVYFIFLTKFGFLLAMFFFFFFRIIANAGVLGWVLLRFIARAGIYLNLLCVCVLLFVSSFDFATPLCDWLQECAREARV